MPAVPDFDLDAFLPYQLAVLAGRMSRGFAQVYADRFGLTVPEWRVVAHLSRARAPLSVREIHARVDMDKSKVSRAAARLEDRGYVEKRTNPADRRLVELTLSDRGRAVVEQINPMALAFEAEALSALSDEDAARFRELVTRLLEDDT